MSNEHTAASKASLLHGTGCHRFQRSFQLMEFLFPVSMLSLSIAHLHVGMREILKSEDPIWTRRLFSFGRTTFVKIACCLKGINTGRGNIRIPENKRPQFQPIKHGTL